MKASRLCSPLVIFLILLAGFAAKASSPDPLCLKIVKSAASGAIEFTLHLRATNLVNAYDSRDFSSVLVLKAHPPLGYRCPAEASETNSRYVPLDPTFILAAKSGAQLAFPGHFQKLDSGNSENILGVQYYEEDESSISLNSVGGSGAYVWGQLQLQRISIGAWLKSLNFTGFSPICNSNHGESCGPTSWLSVIDLPAQSMPGSSFSDEVNLGTAQAQSSPNETASTYLIQLLSWDLNSFVVGGQ